MLDLRAIRKNPEVFDRGWARRGLAPQTPVILDLDERHRSAITEMQELQSRRNEVSKEIGKVKSQGGNADELMSEVSSIKEKLQSLENKSESLGNEMHDLLSGLPNILADEVPDGPDEDHNVEMRKVGEPKRINAQCPDHVDIGEKLGMLDFTTAAKLSGSRFTLMNNGLAKMERALAQFMLDTHTQENGYTEISPPLMVRDEIMYGTAQLPKFRDDQFQVSTGHWLIPTAEVALTNIVADMIVDADELPLRYTAWTPCFRAEAGAAGKDTRGMIRQHQFYKVELVSIAEPDKSVEEHERMTACAEGILKKLDLPFRTVVLCSGDTGFASRKTYDIEVWLPGQQRYREISSCSNCGDFQARRMKARYRHKGDKDTQFVHTLNGSGVAVGRALVAIMENYYDPAEEAIVVPEALRPYMGGMEKISGLTGC
jgi:seryl-tRNA synthetase